MATTITFTFAAGDVNTSTDKLPASVIYGIAYNTYSFGYDPIGVTACNSEVLGCGYDSLERVSTMT